MVKAEESVKVMLTLETVNKNNIVLKIKGGKYDKLHLRINSELLLDLLSKSSSPTVNMVIDDPQLYLNKYYQKLIF